MLRESEWVHVLHITRFSQWVVEQNCSIEQPFILTMGGTDVHVDLIAKGWDQATRQIIDQASALVCFSEEARRMVVDVNPDWESKVRVIPQGVVAPKMSHDVQERTGDNLINAVAKSRKDDETYNILFPAGLRPVKDVLHLLQAWIQLQQEITHLRVKIVGESLDEDVHQQVLKACQTYSFLEYCPAVPFVEMGDLYEQADLVINTSVAEGQPIAICEAMAVGIPVIARDNAGNRAVVHHGQTGYIYHTPADFVQLVYSIRSEPLKAKRMVDNAQRFFEREVTVEKEISAYLDIFKQISDRS